MRFAIFLVFLCALHGCGLKGPLTLPQAQTETQTPGAQLPDPKNPGTPSSRQN